MSLGIMIDQRRQTNNDLPVRRANVGDLLDGVQDDPGKVQTPQELAQEAVDPAGVEDLQLEEKEDSRRRMMKTEEVED